ncbi:MAG: hypothetical protein CMP10_18290 [Zetaproteobacteria bacterium]|mgnify:CR=1 FL=1|nr:hypothetical protein [Pseudobdellovibrionaceae bacterium]
MITKLLKANLAPFSAGLIVGIALYPYFKRGLEQLKPVADDLLDNMIGKAEGVTENMGDSLAKARARAAEKRPKS